MVVRASDSRLSPSSLGSPCCVLEEDAFAPKKVLVIPRIEAVAPCQYD